MIIIAVEGSEIGNGRISFVGDSMSTTCPKMVIFGHNQHRFRASNLKNHEPIPLIPAI